MIIIKFTKRIHSVFDIYYKIDSTSLFSMELVKDTLAHEIYFHIFRLNNMKFLIFDHLKYFIQEFLTMYLIKFRSLPPSNPSLTNPSLVSCSLLLLGLFLRLLKSDLCFLNALGYRSIPWSLGYLTIF